jgi:hypothetical protein
LSFFILPQRQHGVDEEDAKDDLPDPLHHLVERAPALSRTVQTEGHCNRMKFSYDFGKIVFLMRLTRSAIG